MPRTFGDAIIHQSHMDYAVEVDDPLPDHPNKPLSPEEEAIGKHIAENLVDDGATLQMGIGAIPGEIFGFPYLLFFSNILASHQMLS